MLQSVLIIDDETTLVKNIQTYLQRHGFETATACNSEEGLEVFEHFHPDVVLLDLQLGDSDGLEVLRKIGAREKQVKVIIITAHGSVQTAVEAMKNGAYDYLDKPLILAELKLLLEKAIGQERLEEALAYYQGKKAKQSGIERLLGESAVISTLKRQLRQLLQAEQKLQQGTPPAVLITGETGTGKELVARALHFDGQRADKPFIDLNCASIPAHLVEAELFGYERGAFTDAKKRKFGLVEAAHGGTLFLDEVAELDLNLQAKLLRLLENKTIRRLGGLRDREVDVRIIAATNQNLEELIKQGRFRADLLFRLRVMQIEVPPLRQRGDDVLLLAQAFMQWHGKRYGKNDLTLSSAAAAALCQYQWLGNVRELRNVIEQAVVVTESSRIELKHLALAPVTAADEHHDAILPLLNHADHDDFDLNLEQLERWAIQCALQRTSWNVTQAARMLGISRDTLRYRIDKYHLRDAAAI